MVACATNPMTGRTSLNLVSNSDLFVASFQQYGKMLSESKVVTGTRDSKRVIEIGNRIQRAAENYYKSIGQEQALAEYKWEYNLIADDHINAFCMPGGKVAVYTGIMPVAANDNGLAVVMGHEIAHALANHSASRASQQIISQLGMQVGGTVLSGSQWGDVFGALYPIGSELTTLSYGRKDETEADVMGLKLMAMAGYDPREAPVFWGRMQANTKNSGTPEFLSTHPSGETRIQTLNQNMAEAVKIYETYKAKQ
ncbi:MAG: peptidase M48 [Flavobacteriaceae bacterium]|nr:MAG: peptidase M48 [Flavobacteriaceae bacterium]